jgi:mRNA interferase MazF
MKRGEIWTVAGGGDYTGKPRPAVILQDNRFDDTLSVTVCGLTSDPAEVPLIRVRLNPSDTNGLSAVSHVLVDKITTVRRTRLGERIGHLDAAEMTELRQAVLVFLGFGETPTIQHEEAEGAS